MRRDTARTVQAAIRLGDREGPLVGWILEREGRYQFSYDPSYVYSSNAVPLHPFDLPIGDRVFESTGLHFDGPLEVFGLMLPGSFAEKTVFAWLAEQMKTLGHGNALETAPSTPLARLVWSTAAMTFDPGLWGLYFDPCAPYPEGGAKMWLPDGGDGDRSRGWERVQAIIQPREECAVLDAKMYRPRADGSVDVTQSLWAHVAPLPGIAIRLRHKIRESHEQWLVRVSTSVNNIRQLRIKAAYATMASGCGIQTIQSRFRLVGEHEVLFQVALTAERQGHEQGSNGLMDWTLRSRAMPFLPLASWPVKESVFEPTKKIKLAPNVGNPEPVNDTIPFLRNSEDKSHFADGPPVRRLVRYARDLARRGDTIDLEDVFRRVVFSGYCGTFLGDDSPVLMQGSVADAPGRYTWQLPPMGSFSPLPLPHKSAQASAGPMQVFARAMGKALMLDPDVQTRVITEVGRGLALWDDIANEFQLNELEYDCYAPAILQDGQKRKKRGRKQQVSGNPMPNFENEFEQDTSNSTETP